MRRTLQASLTSQHSSSVCVFSLFLSMIGASCVCMEVLHRQQASIVCVHWCRQSRSSELSVTLSGHPTIQRNQTASRVAATMAVSLLRASSGIHKCATQASASLTRRSGHTCFVADVAGSHKCFKGLVASSSHTGVTSALSLSAAHAQPAFGWYSQASVADPSRQSAFSRTLVSPRQLYETLVGAVDAAAADAKKNMQLTGQAASELSYTVESYADMLKQEASSRLKVSPYVLDTPDPQRTKQRLACKLMMALNLDNCVPGLDWTALHPALGVPLLHEMIESGHADELGMPVFQQQPKQPFELGVAGYHELMMQRPRFVGRCVEKYWDDCVVAEPDPFPVIAVSEMAQELLTMRLIETVLGGFEAGRRLLDAARGLGLGGSSSSSTQDAGHVCAKSGAVSKGSASWWDLAAIHPCAVLGVLLLSKPEMPLGVFLRTAAARAVNARTPAAAALPHSSSSSVDSGDEGVCGDVAGGRVWGHGHLTAVGAGDGGSRGAWSLLVPVFEPREHDSISGAVAAQGEGVSVEVHGGIVSRLCVVLGILFCTLSRHAG